MQKRGNNLRLLQIVEGMSRNEKGFFKEIICFIWFGTGQPRSMVYLRDGWPIFLAFPVWSWSAMSAGELLGGLEMSSCQSA